MSIYVSLLTAGTNSHEETSENANAIATDFVSEGVIGATTNTSGVAPSTGAFAVNAQSIPDMTVGVSSGVIYVQGTPTGQNSQMLRVKMTADTSVTVSDNSSGSTKYDWLYVKLDADKMANPAIDADDVATLVTSRSSSSSSDDGTPPTYGYPIAVITVADSASSITNANITDKRALASSVQDNSITPAKRSGGFKVGNFTLNSATGHQAITGVGFTPKLVRFTWLPSNLGTIDSTGYGVMDAAGNQFATSSNNNSTNANNQVSATDHCIIICSNSGGTAASATFVSMDSDGFTINVDVAGTNTIGYEAVA